MENYSVIILSLLMVNVNADQLPMETNNNTMHD